MSGVLIFFDLPRKEKRVTVLPFEEGKRLDVDLLWDLLSLEDEFEGECHCGDLDIDDVIGCVDTFVAGEDDEVNWELDCRERASLSFYGSNYKTCSVINEVDLRLELSMCVVVLGSEIVEPMTLPFGKFLATSHHG